MHFVCNRLVFNMRKMLLFLLYSACYSIVYPQSARVHLEGKRCVLADYLVGVVALANDVDARLESVNTLSGDGVNLIVAV